MSTEKAKAHYLGRSGYVKMNCAQSVAAAFQDKFGLAEDTLVQFNMCGGGRAPQGVCGALYAASHILEKIRPDMLEKCTEDFLDRAGAITCREIRQTGKLSCVGCVEKASQHLENAQTIKKG